MKSVRKALGVGIAAAAVAVGGTLTASALQDDAKPKRSFASRSPRRAPIKIQDGKIPLNVSDCRLELLPKNVIMVGATQTGEILSVEPGEVGQMVKAQNIVCRINSAVMEEKLKAAKKRVASDIEIRYAQKSHDVAKAKLDAAKRKRSAYSTAEMMALKLDNDKTQLQIEKAEVDRNIQGLEQGEIEAELRNYVMKAPISGEVTEILKRTGESVRQGEDIMQIIDLSSVRAIGKVPTRFQKLIRKGTKVTVRLASKDPDDPPPFDDVFEGKITFIKPAVSRVSQSFDVYATVINKQDRNGNYILKEGMLNRIEIILDSNPRVGQQPASRSNQFGTAQPADFRQPVERRPATRQGQPGRFQR